MKMYHVTNRSTLTRIRIGGLIATWAKGKHKTIWIVTEAKIGDAIRHVMLRHRLGIKQVGIVEIDIPKRWVKRGHRGLKHTGGRSIPSALVLRMFGIGEVIVTRPLWV